MVVKCGLYLLLFVVELYDLLVCGDDEGESLVVELDLSNGLLEVERFGL